MEFRLLPDALEVQESERWVKIGGHIKVLARTVPMVLGSRGAY